ncbi:MAG TPA: RloB family protein [Anaerolineales bacterium]|nr:RloB family protein [Anaerolineales bacterium]
MPSKRFVPRTRRSGYRNPKLIIIASEGTHTEKKYFEDLAVSYAIPNLHVEVLDRLDSGSDPESVLKALDKFRSQYSLRLNYDELWLVIDVDRWPIKKLSEVSSLCAQKNYGYAVSNPCFELWLLLHLKALDEYPEEILQEFRENRRPNAKHARTRMELELVTVLGSYSKSNPDTGQLLGNVPIAIERARALDINPEYRWPNDLGTRVYLIAEKIIAKR